MTPQQLKTLIQADAEATAFAIAGNDEGCAMRCGIIAPKIRVSMVLTERGLYDLLGAFLAETILQKLEGFAATQEPMAPVVRRFLKWLQPANGGADFGSTQALEMCHMLMLGGLLTQDECDAIHNLSLVPQTFTAAEIAIAWRGE